MKSEKRNDLVKPYFGELKETPFFHFIIISELPEDQKIPFKKWLRGQTQPIIWDGVDCSYSWDYSIWYDYWIKNEEAPVTD